MQSLVIYFAPIIVTMAYELTLIFNYKNNNKNNKKIKPKN